MKHQELFDRTISILVKAYLNNTLEHTNCYACAVQNIVAGNMGLEITPKTYSHPLSNCGSITLIIKNLTYEETLVVGLGYISEREAKLSQSQKKQMLSTGYSYEHLSNIEESFESINKYQCASEDEYMYKGLMSVVDTLMQIHEADQSEITQAKSLFTKELTV